MSIIMTSELALALLLTLVYAALLVLAFIYFRQDPKKKKQIKK